tara:strand:- start:6144 stop:6455 length:312 start_codon:yes stop_codon:yes gene_type:complete
MVKYALIVTLGALVLALGWIAWQGRSLATLRDDNDRLTRNEAVLLEEAAQAKLAADIADNYIKREREKTIKTAATIEAIRNFNLGDCADAQIDSDLADIIGRR